MRKTHDDPHRRSAPRTAAPSPRCRYLWPRDRRKLPSSRSAQYSHDAQCPCSEAIQLVHAIGKRDACRHRQCARILLLAFLAMNPSRISILLLPLVLLVFTPTSQNIAIRYNITPLSLSTVAMPTHHVHLPPSSLAYSPLRSHLIIALTSLTQACHLNHQEQLTTQGHLSHRLLKCVP